MWAAPLMLALAPLPFDVIWVDPRPEAFPGCRAAECDGAPPEDPAGGGRCARGGSLAFIMSHSHALDLAIADAALRNAGYCPCRPHRQRHQAGALREAPARGRRCRRPRSMAMICPIGVGGIRSKHPAAIAAGHGGAGR